jgi:predicted RNA-binding protein
MCEANAYYQKNGEEELILESVDLVEPEEEGRFRLVNLFGEQKIIKAKLKSMNLVNHKILFEES